MTYRQKVLAVYPGAGLTKHKEVLVWLPIIEGSSYVVCHNLTEHPDDPPEYRSLLWHAPWTAREAWKRAWITTQRRMIEKLEK